MTISPPLVIMIVLCAVLALEGIRSVLQSQSGESRERTRKRLQSLAATLESGRVTFWSRSRQQLWQKGETSGHYLDVEDLRIDCDGDALVVRARPQGPTCHTGRTSCFFRRVEGDDASALPSDDGPSPVPSAILQRIFAVIEDRAAERGTTDAEGKSYVRTLLAAGTTAINAKIAEEAAELGLALAGETDQRVANEAADLLFHTLVGLVGRGVTLESVADVLAARFGQSGIDEKRGRKP